MLHRRLRAVARVQIVIAPVVVGLLRRQRANNAAQVHLLRELRQVLAQVNSRYARFHGLERSACLHARLGIERVQVAWPAIEPHDHALLRLPGRRFRGEYSLHRGREGPAEQPGDAGLNEWTATESW
jgi:hypothetical protein